LSQRERLEDICRFMEYVLEKKKIEIAIPTNRLTVIVTIDGVPRPLSSLGTGVEQSLMIGLASFSFSKKFVLIDELELHFHPRAQKRIISYLNEVDDTHFIVATHSAACLDAVESDILKISEHEGESVASNVQTNGERYRAVRDLGHSPSELIQTRYAIWVEGPSDRIYLNHWIKMIDSGLKEGIDYSILFYGGRILSHHGFDDVENDLVKAVSFSRDFAVLIDSDRDAPKGRLGKTKRRVEEEIVNAGGFCWITQGREIENYIPESLLTQLSCRFAGTSKKWTRYQRILESKKTDKVEYARVACEGEWTEWTLDLKTQVNKLVRFIRAAR
ncbi:MAG: AAA family ATPase, partial [Bauldia sp.]|uniref:ATP-dependent nuclease n=1 Tax=Bauldia sp. TaxID=2575872 RepID=UPI001D97EB0E